MPCRWWKISNCVSPKLLEESKLMELLSSEGNRWDLLSDLDANCGDLSLSPFLWSTTSFLHALLRKEAVKKLLQKHEATLRITIVTGKDAENDTILFQYTPGLTNKLSKQYGINNYNLHISHIKIMHSTCWCLSFNCEWIFSKWIITEIEHFVDHQYCYWPTLYVIRQWSRSCKVQWTRRT